MNSLERFRGAGRLHVRPLSEGFAVMAAAMAIGSAMVELEKGMMLSMPWMPKLIWVL